MKPLKRSSRWRAQYLAARWLPEFNSIASKIEIAAGKFVHGQAVWRKRDASGKIKLNLSIDIGK
jgi:hypothetical protein